MRGLVHSRSTWIVERHLKLLKALARQRTHPEGSMVEGYMLYQNMVYISGYIPKLVPIIDLGCICDPNFINKFEGEYLMGKGRLRKVKGNF